MESNKQAHDGEFFSIQTKFNSNLGLIDKSWKGVTKWRVESPWNAGLQGEKRV